MTKALRNAVRGIKGKHAAPATVPDELSQAGAVADVEVVEVADVAQVANSSETACITDAVPGTRRRGEDLEAAILDATLDLLAENGLGPLTMEGVAAAAHTGKASVYRRWPSKEDLLVDAIARALPPIVDPPNTGSVRADLLALLRLMLEVINSRTGCALQSFMFDNSVDKELVAQVKKRAMEPRHQMLVDVLAAGRDRGEVRADAVNAYTAEVGPALIVHQFLMHGPPVPDAFVVQLVDNVLMPLLRP